MKKYSIYSSILFLLVFFSACKKFDFDYSSTGEAIGAFKLSTPVDNNDLLLNSAAPGTSIIFKWTTAAKGVAQDVKYTWKLDLKSGDFSQPIWQKDADNNGTDTKLTLTHKSLDSLLTTKGIASNTLSNLKWTVVASNESGTKQTPGSFNLNVKTFGIGITAFTIFAPASSTNILTTNPLSETDFLNFKWEKATAVPSSNTVHYTIVFVKKAYDIDGNVITPNFNNPLFSFAANGNGVDNFGNISFKQMSDSLNIHGLNDLGVVSQLQWTVIATAGDFSSQANFYNDLYLIREIKMYMVGGFQGWNPDEGIQMIPDTRSGLLNNMYYTYIYMPAGEFKFLEGKSWSDPSYGQASAGSLELNSNTNLNIPTAGVYRITMNRTTMKYDISAGRMAFVGAATPAGWDPPTAFPLTEMVFINTNQFVGVRSFTTDIWKMIDNTSWDNGSQSVDETRSYSSDGPSGSKMKVNDGNMPSITTAGDYRVVWDAKDVKNPIYQLMPITEMRVVGDGMASFPDWYPTASPQMTYQGNGIWKITLSLKADKSIKFLAGNDWGAFDYEDAGNGKIKYDGSDNFKTPATDGSYTITLDENKGTYTIL